MEAMITAHVQHSKMHMWPARPMAEMRYPKSVPKQESAKVSLAKSEAIRSISRWAEAVQKSAGKSAPKIAADASFAPTTITRGMSAKAKGTTKIENLHLMARSAGVPSVLDFLDGQAAGADTPPLAWVPSEQTLMRALRAVLRDAREARETELDLQCAAHGLSEGLKMIADDHAREGDDSFLSAVEKRIFRAIAEYKQRRDQDHPDAVGRTPDSL